MATIKGLYLRGNTYWYNFQIGGHRQRVSLQTNDLAIALSKVEEIRANPKAGTAQTILALIEPFIAHKLQEGRYTDSTQRAARVSLNDLAAYCTRLPLESIRDANVQGWFNKLRERSSEATAQTHLNRAKAFFRWAKESGLSRFNPAAGIATGRLPKPAMQRFCTREERDILIYAAPAKSALRFILFCGFYAGLRRNEISEARYDWFDLDAQLLHVRKTETFTPKDRDERSIPIAKPLLRFLKSFPLGEPYAIEPSVTRGASLYRYDFRRPFSDHAKKCNLPWVTPHIMRHTFASLHASSGVSIYKIALWLGDDVKTVQRHYAKLVPGDDDINASN